MFCESVTTVPLSQARTPNQGYNKDDGAFNGYERNMFAYVERPIHEQNGEEKTGLMMVARCH